uniref:HAT C-terminal dimerisation domain-containing protein n=1 Tax=Knipowitschia caucasica TaxID=637954 RepID=A0AAV2IYW7_KNICA
MARSQDGITAPFSDPVYLKAAVLDPAFSLLWVEPHVLVNRDIKAEVAQQVKELILQDAAETEQPVLLGDEEDLGEGEGLFGAYRKRQKKDVGTSPALQLSHYLDIADGESALLFWALNMKTLPSLYRVAIRVLAVPASSAPVERVFSHGQGGKDALQLCALRSSGSELKSLEMTLAALLVAHWLRRTAPLFLSFPSAPHAQTSTATRAHVHAA